MGQETHTIHLNFQVGLKAHLEERVKLKKSYSEEERSWNATHK
jgi:hypothetical protein